ncbi:MAG: thioredoxin domain-containing protein [Crocinitomicaceae bacterium]|nr:thioredoxin domain-containing protein [Crocinitomicaceae bacterium]
MKKNIKILLITLTSVLMLMSVSNDKKGISFSDITLKEAKSMATDSEKLIFIDCYTDWCGPCKRMAATSFKDEEVGKVFNQKFINLKIEMEKNPEGNELARRYQVRAYPTLLVIDANGNLIKKVIGMQNVNGLLTLASTIK